MSVRLGQLCAYLALVSMGAGTFGALAALDAWPFFLGSAGFFACLAAALPSHIVRAGLGLWALSQVVLACRFYADNEFIGNIAALMMVGALVVLMAGVFRAAPVHNAHFKRVDTSS